MSNIQPDSVIACLDAPSHVQAVLDASMWAAKALRVPIGLLHAVPSVHHKSAIDYSGCLVADNGSQLLMHLTLSEQDTNGKRRDQGRALLKDSDAYCKKYQGRYEHQVYALHRLATIAESLHYVDDMAQLIVIGHQVTCKNTLSQLIRPIKSPTLITHKQFKTPKTALFAFDNSATCKALLDWLCSNALVRHMTIHIALVGQATEQNKDALREAYARLKQSGISCKKALLEGRDVTATLIYYQQTNHLELLITGAFGESRWHELLHGSDTQKLLSSSQTPYLLYPRS